MTKDINHITLQEASVYTPYDSNYLGLLIRKKSLFGVKRKGKWWTTREAIDEYMATSARRELVPTPSRVNSFLARFGFGVFVVAVIFLLGAVSDSVFSKPEVKERVTQSSIEKAWSMEGVDSTIVGEGSEVTSSRLNLAMSGEVKSRKEIIIQ